MKKTFTLCCVAIIAAAPICLSQKSQSKPSKSAASESAITDLEKSAWEAYKNKQTDAFKALLSKDYCGVYADGTKTLDAEVADMAKTAVITYKATQQATSGGKDISGTYNSGSVWVQHGGKWVGVFHTETKVQ